MSLPASESNSAGTDAGWFATTDWSVVLAAKEGEAGKRELFERLQAFLVEGTGDKTFAKVAQEGGHDGGGREEGGAADAPALSSAFPGGDSPDRRHAR